MGRSVSFCSCSCLTIFLPGLLGRESSETCRGIGLVVQAWCSSSKLDSELETSGLRGPAGRSPARPPIFSAHPCARWHRSGRRFKYLYCVHTCVTGRRGGLAASVPGAPADVEGEPGLSLTETLGQVFGSRFFALNSTPGLSALPGDGLRESHPFLSGHVDGCYRA